MAVLLPSAELLLQWQNPYSIPVAVLGFIPRTCFLHDDAGDDVFVGLV
jgi:hypothetical protein